MGKICTSENIKNFLIVILIIEILLCILIGFSPVGITVILSGIYVVSLSIVECLCLAFDDGTAVANRALPYTEELALAGFALSLLIFVFMIILMFLIAREKGRTPKVSLYIMFAILCISLLLRAFHIVFYHDFLALVFSISVIEIIGFVVGTLLEIAGAVLIVIYLKMTKAEVQKENSILLENDNNDLSL